MRTHKRLIKYVMFLLPALIALIAYTALYERLHQPAECIINCDQNTFSATRELQLNFQKMLKLLDEASLAPAKRQVAVASTPLDLAFMQEKLADTLDLSAPLTSSSPLNNNLPLITSPDAIIAEELNTLADPIGLAQATHVVLTKQSITLPDSLSAAINGLNPPLIIQTVPARDGNSTLNVASRSQVTTPSNSQLTPSSNVIENNPSPVSTVPLPNAFYLMLAGLSVLLMLNRSANT